MKAYRAGYQTIPRILKWNDLSNFSRPLMRALESPFECYKSKRILFFANFIFSSVSGPKALKKACLRFAIFNYSKKLQNIFDMGLKKCRVIVQKSLLKKKYFEIKNSQTLFVVYMLNWLLSLLNPFWNHWLSLQSDWLSMVRFIHESHYFLL